MKISPIRRRLLLGVALAALALLVTLLLTLGTEPTPDPEPTQAATQSQALPTEAPEPTEPPTEPPKYLNRYTAEDFQTLDGYLALTEGEYRLGIDVSVYQGEIDWQAVKDAGMEFVMIRLGYRGYGTGKILEDVNFRANLEGAQAAGLDVGVYFFSQAVNVKEAIEEAQFVLDTLDGCQLQMPVAYDWEYIDDQARTADMDRRTLTNCSIAFMKRISNAGYRPMLYYNTFQVRKLLHLSELEEYDCWLALYSQEMTFPYRIRMWQYTCTGSVPGIEGDVDINLYFPED